jgi:hypothetical protein
MKVYKEKEKSPEIINEFRAINEIQDANNLNLIKLVETFHFH